MSLIAGSSPRLTATSLARRLGPMPLSRIRFDPFPGTATEEDVIAIYARERRLYELADGILVEKAVGFRESILAGALIQMIRDFLKQFPLGTVTAPDGMMRLSSGLIRIPDVAFIAWERFPNRQVPDEPVPNLAPDLAVEILSASNTRQEMNRKLQDYFAAGCRLVWFVDPRGRSVTVYTAPDQSTRLEEDQTLDGGMVLPGLTLPLRQLFAELDPH
jgi:Uma2 family endonuclease